MDAFKPYLAAVGRGEKLKRDLTYAEAYSALGHMLAGRATPAQLGAFLIAQRVKGEAVAEVSGFVACVRDQFAHLIAPRVSDLLDLATPFDGKTKTAQLAPAIAFVLVAAGIPVLLAGGQGVPTKNGVTVGAVLAGLGVAAFLPPAAVSAQIEAVGLGHYDACYFAPEWEALTAVRQQFGLRTVCNTAEKFFNLANAPYQISGFFHGNYIRRVRAAQTGTRRSFIVQGEEGSVEVAAGRRTPVFGHREAADFEVDAADLGFGRRERLELPPTLAAHVALNASVLAGENGAAADQVALSAGTFLCLLGSETTVAAGLEKAQRLLTSKAAAQAWQKAAAWQREGMR